MTDDRSPRPHEFRRFIKLLTADAPDGYTPWLFRVQGGSKAPATKYGSWKDDDARLSVDEALAWMKGGGNVGIAGRPDDPLINVDIDDEDETAVDDLKPTLAARSRSRAGVHAWYFEAPGAEIPNIPTDEAGEVRANWQYVVAPGSYVDTDPDDVPDGEEADAGFYTVEREEPVTSLRLEELPEVFRQADEPDPEQQSIEAPDPDFEPERSDEGDDDRRSALFEIEAADVVRKEGGSTKVDDRWPSLFHGSETDENMALSDRGLLHCWRHNVAHNGLQALAVLSDYPGACAAVGSSHKGANAGESCLNQEEGAHLWHAWKYAKENGYIPDDDPVPYAALMHLCRERDLCAVTELPDGADETIPAHAYDAALSTIEEHDGLDPGRQATDEIDDSGAKADDSGQATATADGGTAAASADDSGPRLASTLEPESVRVVAAVDTADGEEIADLDDRAKAAAVWELIGRSNEVHVRVRRDNGSLWAFDGGIWKNEGERALRHAARQALGAANYGGNVLEELKAQARADPTAEIERDTFGLGDGAVAVENGHLDLRAAAEGEPDALRPLRPSDYALARLPVPYDGDAEGERWREFVDTVVETPKVDAVQEYVGYCLHRSGLPINRALLLVGTGSNGKSTFLNTVKKLLGSENVQNTPLHKFADDDRVAGLHGKLANIDADLSEGSLSKEGVAMFKRLTGDDPVEGRHLYEDAFQFKPVAKHLYAANQVPDVSNVVGDDDVAFWRRWLIVKFPTYIREPDRDPDLGDELERELPGVLNWAIEGWARCRDQGGFTGAETYEETRDMWKKWGESADEFLLEVCESDSDATNLHTSEVNDVYRSWCRQNGRDAVDQRELTMTLKRDDADFGYKQSVRTGRNSVREGFKRLGFDEVVHDALADVLAENDDSVEDVDSGQTGLDDVGE